MLLLRNQTAIVEAGLNWYNELPVRKEARRPRPADAETHNFHITG